MKFTREERGPMSREEMLEMKAGLEREVARLRSLPSGHPAKRLDMKGRKLSEREVRYLEALEKYRQEDDIPDFGVRASASASRS